MIEVILSAKKEDEKEAPKSFVILGQVRKPGSYQFGAKDKKMTLLEAISLAGGFSDVANIKKIKILRGQGTEKKTIRANAEAIIGGSEDDVDLEAGDIVNVSESLF